jgi:RNA polymerase sigma-70 factor (ECF subfamily)
MAASPAAAKAWPHSETDCAATQMPGVTKLERFEYVILPHLDAAYNLARWLTRNEHDAEDVTQEAYLRAFRFFDTFHGGDAKSWLLSVVRNTCYTWRRRESAAASKIMFDEHTHTSGPAPRNAEQVLLTEENLKPLRECIEALPQEFREVLVMRDLEEMSYKQISDAAAIPIGTVMSRLSRARQRLKDCASRKTGASQ